MSTLASKFKAGQTPRSGLVKHKGSFVEQKGSFFKLMNKSNSGVGNSSNKKRRMSKQRVRKVNISLKGNSSAKVIVPRKTITQHNYYIMA